MTRTADVVVIGGGANGTSTAFDLAVPCRASRFAEGRPWHDADHDGGHGLTISR